MRRISTRPAIQPAPASSPDTQGVDPLDRRSTEGIPQREGGDQEVPSAVTGSGHNASTLIASTVQTMTPDDQYSEASGWRTVTMSYHGTWDTRESASQSRSTPNQATGRRSWESREEPILRRKVLRDNHHRITPLYGEWKISPGKTLG